ncbi:hypothetical protein JNUCC0626_47405 [Lentzea sp. JNUCC 0626]|uniref:hypothetical protein n=1 Tax=Lentzea sp. JNUCC 0626 TaxID=3367513 RepID=UPI00374887A2
MSAGYRVEDWVGAAPEHLIASYARALEGMRDAPVGESRYQAPEWTVDRVRAIEDELRGQGVERRVVVAVHEATGDVAGVTQMDLYSAAPTCGYQQDTTVVWAHRGHGLGVCVKAYMVRLLRSQRPEVSRVETTTNADNTHMIRINHRIGFTTTRTAVGISAEMSELSELLGD